MSETGSESQIAKDEETKSEPVNPDTLKFEGKLYETTDLIQ